MSSTAVVKPVAMMNEISTLLQAGIVQVLVCCNTCVHCCAASLHLLYWLEVSFTACQLCQSCSNACALPHDLSMLFWPSTLNMQVRHCKDGQESTLSSPYDPHSICKHELLAETALPLEALAALAAAQCKQAGTAQWLEVKAPLYLPEDVAHGADGHGLVIATSSMSSRIGSGFSKAAAPARGDVSSFTSGSGEACGGASDLMFLRDVGAVDHGQELGLGDKMHVQSPGRDQIVQTVQTGQGQGQSQTGAAVASQQPSQHGADQSNHQQTSGKLAGGAADAGNSICQQTHLGPSSMQHSKRLVYDPLDMIAYNDDHRQPGGFITLRVRVCAERRLPILPEQPKPSPVLQQDQSNAATHPSSPTAASSSSSTCSQSQSNASGLSPAALAPMANPSSTDTTDTSASCTKLGMLKRSNALTVDGKRAAFAALYGIGPSPPLPTKQPTRDTKQSQVSRKRAACMVLGVSVLHVCRAGEAG